MIKVNVIEGQRKVVARLDNCGMDVYNILRKRLPDYIDICPAAVQIKNTFKASAVCHPDDTFDEAKGIELARQRVIAKYNQAVAKVLDAVGVDVEDYLSYVDTRLEHFDK